MGFLIVLLFCFRNYLRAKAQAQSGIKWAIFTFLAVFAGWFIGSLVTAIILMVRYPEIIQAAGTPDITPQEVSAIMLERMNVFVTELFLFFSGLGGYLWIRHRLIKLAEKQFS